ncbi:NAD P-binding protein [Mycena sanguinolenta]|uniref:NAD P-binding protein n=1 Tax=Mycena sanguinolenta TaxID=230812 RepID=A0A8H6YCZ3_9AGAR|nr:NAD P-binding protein [Mycena sanguinolenta]
MYSQCCTKKNPAVIINTGSKQGITNPPGNAAYNASKAAVKSLTEGLAHALRERNGGGNVTAHLFVPGYTFTGLTGAKAGTEKPAGAWSADETIDQLRVMWAAADVAQGRPALSRWHRDYKALFEEYMREGQALAAEGVSMK